MRRDILLAMLIFFACVLVACGGSGGRDAAETVEAYLTAKVGRDADTVRSLLCSEMESVMEREMHAFDTVSDAEIVDMACTAVDEDTVSCEGRIVASYGAEETEFALSTYRVVEEDGEWRWCGEAR